MDSVEGASQQRQPLAACPGRERCKWEELSELDPPLFGDHTSGKRLDALER